MRPFEQAPVGRTVVAPPPELAGATSCLATDDGAFVRLAPDCQGSSVHQPGRPVPPLRAFGRVDGPLPRSPRPRATEAAAVRHPRRGDERRCRGPPAAVHGLEPGTDAQLAPELRPLTRSNPAPAVSRREQGRRAAAVPSARFSAGTSTRRCHRSSCRQSTLWVIVGYSSDGSGHDGVTLYRHDDSAGPYLEDTGPVGRASPQHRPWLVALPPSHRSAI